MKKKIAFRFAILSIIIFLLCTCIFTFFYDNKDRYQARDWSIEEKTEKKSSKEWMITMEEVPDEDKIVYTCPEGYTLHDTKCTITTNMSPSCGEMTSFLDGCIILSEGTNSLDGTCPNGQGLLEDKCYPIYSYSSYTCPEGYQLKDNSCYQEIEAIVK